MIDVNRTAKHIRYTPGVRQRAIHMVVETRIITTHNEPPSFCYFLRENTLNTLRLN